MQKYQKLLIMFAFLFAMLTTFLGYRLFLSIASGEEEPVNLIKVPIAVANLEAITVIEEKHIKYIEIPEETVNMFSIVIDEEEILGKVLLAPVNKESPFTSSDVLDEENDIPFHLPEDYRAITIGISPVSSVAGFLREGMYVDILWTYEFDSIMHTSIPFQNVKILAIGSSSQNGNMASNEQANTITLMLKPEDAQLLTFMTNSGQIKLMMRSSPIIPTNYLPPVYMEKILEIKVKGGLDNGEN